MAGSIRERGPRYWELRVGQGFDPVTKRYRRTSVYVRGSRRDAERALAKMVGKAAEGRHGGTEATVATLLEEWYAQLVYEDKSPNTLAGYRWRIDKVIVPRLGKIPLKKLRTSDLDALYRACMDHEAAPRTVRQHHAVLRRALGQAVRWGWLEVNPAIQASPPSVRRADVTAPAPEDVQRLLKAAEAHNPDWFTFLVLAATAGARSGEVCGLQSGDFDAGVVTIRRSVAAPARQPVTLKDTKTHATRKVPLDAATWAVVERHIARMTAKAQQAGATVGPSSFLFSDDLDGARPRRPTWASHEFARLRAGVGLEGVRLQDCRHFVATQLLASGVDVLTVAHRLGHASAKMTLDVYGHALEAKGREAGDLMGQLLRGRTTGV